MHLAQRRPSISIHEHLTLPVLLRQPSSRRNRHQTLSRPLAIAQRSRHLINPPHPAPHSLSRTHLLSQLLRQLFPRLCQFLVLLALRVQALLDPVVVAPTARHTASHLAARVQAQAPRVTVQRARLRVQLLARLSASHLVASVKARRSHVAVHRAQLSAKVSASHTHRVRQFVLPAFLTHHINGQLSHLLFDLQ